jgi:hypothetical protein
VKLDISEAFTSGRRGVSVWFREGNYQVSVKQSDGSFSVGIAPDLYEAYRIALREDDLL